MIDFAGNTIVFLVGFLAGVGLCCYIHGMTDDDEDGV